MAESKEEKKEVKTEVRPCAFGKGLFALKKLPREFVVAETSPEVQIFNRRARKNKVSLEEIESKLEGKGLPHDAAVSVNNYIFAELGAEPSTLGTGKYLWYSMNHASGEKANVKVSIQRKKSKVVGLTWKTRVEVPKGAQLFFDYGEPDPEWK